MPYQKPPEPRFAKLGRTLKGYGIGQTRLCYILDISPNTAKRKLDDPSRLTLADLDAIVKRGHVPADELRESITFGAGRPRP